MEARLFSQRSGVGGGASVRKSKKISLSSLFRASYKGFLSHSWLRSFRAFLAPKSWGAEIEFSVSFGEKLVFPAVEEH